MDKSTKEFPNTDVLPLLAKITSITDLQTLLDTVVDELPQVVGALGCWVYLEPEYVSSHENFVVRNGQKTETNLLEREFVVLASTNRANKKENIGKAYFCSGEGIVGWVYKNGNMLNINDITNEKALKSISNSLYWADLYKDSDGFYHPADPIPLLITPLVLENETIGVIKFHAVSSGEVFSEISEQVASVIAQTITGVIRQTWLVNEQNRVLSEIIELSAKQNLVDVILGVTGSIKKMFNASKVQFFEANNSGDSVNLIIQNGQMVEATQRISFCKRESLIGWVFSTGFPLVLPNIRKYLHGVKLDEKILEEISSGDILLLDSKDIILKCEEPITFFTGRLKTPVPFLAVPVKSRHNDILGIIAAYWDGSNKLKIFSDKTQLHIAQSFASTISLALENTRQKELASLLTRLGYQKAPDDLFTLVVNEIPNLIPSSSCSIFMLRSGENTSVLRLLYSSRQDISTVEKSFIPIEYKLGQGKTGVCGSTKSTLVVKHFGEKKASQYRLQQDVKRIEENYPDDAVDILLNSQKLSVGLVQLWGGKSLSLTHRLAYKEVFKKIFFEKDGLPSAIMKKNNRDFEKSWSYIAVPILREKKLLGVITLNRPTPQIPFSPEDVSLVKAIAGHLGNVMENLELQDQRKKLVMSLAHEIHTPLTGILATAEGLALDLPEKTELREMAEHTLGQVLRLHLQTSTIMAVLSEASPERKFSLHSIYRPLKEASELFKMEATYKGCDIVGPYTSNNESFPVIEMSLFDLTIAFKNIVHNAIKYSFRPHRNSRTKRYIRIWGEIDSSDGAYYLVNIQNYGVGITKQEIVEGLIFRHFYRGVKSSDRRRTGAGFGLAHAKQIIEKMHHGKILVSSDHQGGDAYLTTFTIKLPIRQ